MRSFKAVFLLLILSILASPAFGAGSIQKANAVLEKWTSTHWGRDCFVWIAHYSEELVDPWVRAESEKLGMSAQEKEQYKRDFMNELKMSESEVFLFSLYSFGSSGMDLSPFSKSILLRTRTGKEYAPTSYDPILDSPIHGVVQGIVFFPKQEETEFSLIVRGLGISEEMEFPFPFSAGISDPGIVRESVSPRAPVTRADVIVLPTSQQAGAEISSSEGSVVSEDAPLPVSSEEPNVEEDVPPVGDGLSKEEVISIFLDGWVEGDYDVMYDLLSTESRKKYSRNSFTASAMQSPFRLVLKGGYETRWIDRTQVEVIAKADLMIMSTLKRRVFRMMETGDAWRISW